MASNCFFHDPVVTILCTALCPNVRDYVELLTPYIQFIIPNYSVTICSPTNTWKECNCTGCHVLVETYVIYTLVWSKIAHFSTYLLNSTLKHCWSHGAWVCTMQYKQEQRPPNCCPLYSKGQPAAPNLSVFFLLGHFFGFRTILAYSHFRVFLSTHT